MEDYKPRKQEETDPEPYLQDHPPTVSIAHSTQALDLTNLARLNGYEVEAGVIQISQKGNVILRFRSDLGLLTFQVQSAPLIAESIYFRNLLDPSRGFAEAQLLTKGGNGALPVVELEMPADQALPDSKESWLRNAVRLAKFLHTLHLDRQMLGNVETQKVDDLFFLSLCWDRFIVDKALSLCNVSGEKLKKRKIFQPGYFGWPSWDSKQESDCRKTIFACYRLGLYKYLPILTQKLIVMGSVVHNQWLGCESTGGDLESIIWHLPAQLEEEIFERRRAVLGKLAARVDHYITQYSSATLQCRFGYGTSNACDIFQLGQMLRFFGRKQVAELRSVPSLLGRADPLPMYDGSIVILLKVLRGIPDSQIDLNHQHCGVRKDLVPLLDTFEAVVNREKCIGVCGLCWRTNQDFHRWIASPVPVSAGICPDVTAHAKGRGTFEEGLTEASHV